MPTCPRRRRWLGALLPALMVIMLGGCQLIPTPGRPTEPPEVRPEDYLITVDALPDGWKPGDPQDADYRADLCGVDIEPSPPTAVAYTNFQQDATGPFIEQYVRTYADDTAERVLADLAEAVPRCTSFVAPATAESERATVLVEPAAPEFAKPGLVAWRQHPEERPHYVSELVFLRRGNSMILLLSFDVAGEYQVPALERAVAAVPE